MRWRDKMFRVAVVDDNPVFLEKSKKITGKFFEERKLECEIKTYERANSVIEEIKERQYFDVFLIDIEMPDVDGMELARQIRRLYDSPYIIFVTSHVEYSIKGYEYNVWRYIIKENMAENLPQAYESLIEQLKQKKEKFYIVEHPKKLLKILYEDIHYIYKDGKNAVFVTKNNVWSDRKSLEQVMQALNDPMFVRCERGNIANIRHIMTMKDNVLKMRNGDQLPVSSRNPIGFLHFEKRNSHTHQKTAWLYLWFF